MLSADFYQQRSTVIGWALGLPQQLSWVLLIGFCCLLLPAWFLLGIVGCCKALQLFLRPEVAVNRLPFRLCRTTD